MNVDEGLGVRIYALCGVLLTVFEMVLELFWRVCGWLDGVLGSGH
jgi:hypothetical protein